jgi:hypothetical protein
MAARPPPGGAAGADGTGNVIGAVVVKLLAIVLLLPCTCLAMEQVQISHDGKGFVVAVSGDRFVPWGLNYGHPDQLIEDFWNSDWGLVEHDFRYMHSLGANVVRVHLQFARFMKSPQEPDQASLELLGRLLSLSEKTGLYLDLTGLACYRTRDVPAWYDRLDESHRWAAQLLFWEAVADRCKNSPAVFCYDLMNEPFVPGPKREPGQWYSGKPLGGFDFVQFISLDPAGRPREQIAAQWVRTLSKAIRGKDPHHLITVGMLPSMKGWGFLSGFVPKVIAPELDFIAVHIYPEKGKTDVALAMLKTFAVGRPVVIEETFPLACGADELRRFLLDSRGTAAGWMGHYNGQSIEELSKPDPNEKNPLARALWLDWLKLFKELGPQMTRGR